MTQRTIIVLYCTFQIFLLISTAGFSGELCDGAADGEGLWLEAGHLAMGTQDHTLTLLPGGEVLLTGGINFFVELTLDRAAVYDPGLGRWRSVDRLEQARFEHTATLLVDGTVLVVGGGHYVDGVLASAEIFEPESETWVSVAQEMLTARRRHTTTRLLDGRVLVVGGGDGMQSLANVEIYDPVTRGWTSAESLGKARGAHTSTLLADGRVLVVGGFAGTVPVVESEIYDPQSNSWTLLPGPAVARGQHSATLLPNGLILIVGGSSEVTTMASAELFDPAAGEWSSAAPMIDARRHFAASLLPDGRLLVVGGSQVESGGCLQLAGVELYDPATDTWESAMALDVARSQAAATLLPSGRLLIVGGVNEDLPTLSQSQIYAPEKLVGWSHEASLNEARKAFSAVPLPAGNLLAVSGRGSDGLQTASVEMYDQETGDWSYVEALTTARTGHSVTVLASGHVLAVGGIHNVNANQNEYLASIQIFDPSTESWSLQTEALQVGRIDHSATLLNSGEVLICGGRNANFLASCEILDPASSTSVLTSSMAHPRIRHQATALGSGRVLITGGSDGVSNTDTVDLYDPLTGQLLQRASMAASRGRHGQTVLVDGRVLVTGGGSNGTAGVEIYQPDLDLWHAAEPMLERRSRHEARLLPTGEVLVAGGRRDGVSLATSEIYDPGTNTWRLAGSLAQDRDDGSLALLNDGRLLFIGGIAKEPGAATITLASVEAFDVLGIPPERRRPAILDVSEVFSLRTPLEIMATGIRGDSSASSNNTKAAASDWPLIQLHSLTDDRVIRLEPDWPLDFETEPALMTVSELPALAPGQYRVSLIAGGVPSHGALTRAECEPWVIEEQPRLEPALPNLGEAVDVVVETLGGRFFQWYREVTDETGTHLLPLPGANGSTYTLPALGAADVGTVYRVLTHSGCSEELSQPVVINVHDTRAPEADVLQPTGGEFWLLGSQQLITWQMTDDVRICRLTLQLLSSADDGSCDTFEPIDDGAAGILIEHDAGVACGHPGVLATSFDFAVPPVPPATTPPDWLQPGLRYHVRVSLEDQAGNTTEACSARSFNLLLEDDPERFHTLILAHPERMRSQMDLSDEQVDTLRFKLQEFADHPRVDGLVVDLGQIDSLAPLYDAWDLEPQRAELANDVLFASGGIHDELLRLLEDFAAVRYLMVAGDDRIVPMARLTDRTMAEASESVYVNPPLPLEPGLTDSSTVGAALAAGFYLSDDPLATEGLLEPARLDDFLFVPDRALGRLVETPEEIAGAIDTFIARGGVLDLSDPLLEPNKVLVSGYDFLADSASQIHDYWRLFLGQPEGTAPLNGELIGVQWPLPPGQDPEDALYLHLSGNLPGHPVARRYGIVSLNGHSNHFGEGVPTGDPHFIAGLPASEIYGSNSCNSSQRGALDLSGSLIYAVGCHGGLSVPGSCGDAQDPDHSLDLPQAYLARGVLAYVANSGFGWGLLHGVGYSERLVQLMTEELAVETVTAGAAVVAAKRRYHQETPRLDSDPYSQKTIMQWSLYGFPMLEVSAVGASAPTAGPLPASQPSRLKDDEERIVATTVRHDSLVRNGVATPLPDYLTRLEITWDVSAPGVYEKLDSQGNLLTEPGCPDADGCYFSANGLTLGSTDLPLEPYILYDSRLSGTSQHGVLWLGGVYRREEDWRPVIGQLISNPNVVFDPGSTPRMLLIGPLTNITSTVEVPACRTNDSQVLNMLLLGVGESEQIGSGGDSWLHHRHLEYDAELFYFNQPAASCDRQGPRILDGPFGGSHHQWSGGVIHWQVAAEDDEGEVWRVVVVYTDHLVDGAGEGRWLPLELQYDTATEAWVGELPISEAVDRLTYVVQAVDDRGNVRWLQFIGAESPSSGVPLQLPLPVGITIPQPTCVESNPLFCDGFESGDLSAWGTVVF